VHHLCCCLPPITYANVICGVGLLGEVQALPRQNLVPNCLGKRAKEAKVLAGSQRPIAENTLGLMWPAPTREVVGC
jgi:hypothetical protein